MAVRPSASTLSYKKQPREHLDQTENKATSTPPLHFSQKRANRKSIIKGLPSIAAKRFKYDVELQFFSKIKMHLQPIIEKKLFVVCKI